MPQRTNSFQRVVALAHAGLGDGWRVTESKMLVDITTGELREVDVVAESTVGEYRVILALECRDHDRAATVGWVEEMHSKHQDLPTDKLILWSRSGFSKSALAKARARNIQALSPDDAAHFDWAELARHLTDGLVKYVGVEFDDFIDVVASDGTKHRHPARADLTLGEPGDMDGILVGMLVEALHALPELRTVILDHATEGPGEFYAEYSPPKPWTIWDGAQPLGTLMRLGIALRTRAEVSPLETRSMLYAGAAHTVATAKLTTGQLEMYAKEQPGLAPAVVTSYVATRQRQ